MSANNYLGIIYANVHDDFVPSLTKKRSMASLPFGARYRVIDFHLSNLVNAGVTKVGILTNNNYQSLMDHVGTGGYWDLDRKRGGLVMLPPFSTYESGVYTSHIDALTGAMGYLRHSKQEYVILCDSDVVGNFDLSEAIKQHEETGADISLLYANGNLPKNNQDIAILKTDSENRVTAVEFANDAETANYCLDVMIIKRELLMKIITDIARKGLSSMSHDIIAPAVNKLNVYGIRHNGFVKVIDNEQGFIEANMELLKTQVRKDLFNASRPVYTKTRDDMPTRYGINACVKNSLIADGCIINGTVKNCIIFRGVKIDEGTVVENCILMQDTTVGKNCRLTRVLADKRVSINDETHLCGKVDKYTILEKEVSI